MSLSGWSEQCRKEIEKLWVEKYRPDKLDDVLLSGVNNSLFKGFVERRDIPNLMFVGMAGVGKTTVAKILVREIGGDCLELNASDERGIDTIRGRVKRFLATEVTVGRRVKVVFFDEADYITTEGQAALRNIIEMFSDIGRVIFSVNYLHRVLPAIVSRCQVIEFRPISVKMRVILFEKILKNEGIEYNLDDIVCLGEDCKGDLRAGILALQKASYEGSFKYETREMFSGIEELLDVARRGDWKRLYSLVTASGDYSVLYRQLFDLFWDRNTEKEIAVVGEYMYRDGVVFDRAINFLLCIRELVKYMV